MPADYVRPAFALRVDLPLDQSWIGCIDAAGQDFGIVLDGPEAGILRWLEPGDSIVLNSDVVIPTRGRRELRIRGPVGEALPEEANRALYAVCRERRGRARPEARDAEERQRDEHGRRPSPEPTVSELAQALTALRAELADMRAGRGRS